MCLLFYPMELSPPSVCMQQHQVPGHLKPKGGSISPLSRKAQEEPPSKCKPPQVVMGEHMGSSLVENVVAALY